MATTAQHLAEALVSEPLDDWLDQRRSTGRSWRLIARDLYEATGGKVDVSPETLRVWSRDASAGVS